MEFIRHYTAKTVKDRATSAYVERCAVIRLCTQMGGLEGVRSRESTHLTLQTRGTKGIRMVLHPRWV